MDKLNRTLYNSHAIRVCVCQAVDNSEIGHNMTEFAMAAKNILFDWLLIKRKVISSFYGQL